MGQEQPLQQTAQTSFQVTNTNCTLELSQRRWFYMALDSSCKTCKQEAESPTQLLELINQSVVVWVDYTSDDPVKDLPALAAKLGFSELLISSVSGGNELNYQDFDSEMFMRLPSIQIRGHDVQAYPLLFLIKKGMVFTIHSRLVDKRFIRLRRYSDVIMRRVPVNVPPEIKLTLLLTRIIDANNDSNFRHLRAIEEFGDDLNKDLMDPDTDRTLLAPKIYEMKHALIIYMNALWESADVLHAIRYGDAELITDDEHVLNKVSFLADEVKSQLGLSEHMSEVLASGIEATQSIYNNQLTISNNQLTIANNQLTKMNNRFALLAAYLAIVGTALLIPNTIATMLGNSVWVYGPADFGIYITLIIGATAVGSLIMWFWIRKHDLLPKDKEP
ncbi:MAG: CorA family divalent cation transporter [Candidatus Bathyarchaeia archaeon]|jgi:magnesium transporter